MSVASAFEKARADNRAALVGYLPAGFPTVDGGILEPCQLIDAAQLLFAFARTREALDERREKVPRLVEISRRLPFLEAMTRRIDQCFDRDAIRATRAEWL